MKSSQEGLRGIYGLEVLALKGALDMLESIIQMARGL
jgi:hypothetical protein